MKTTVLDRYERYAKLKKEQVSPEATYGADVLVNADVLLRLIDVARAAEAYYGHSRVIQKDQFGELDGRLSKALEHLYGSQEEL